MNCTFVVRLVGCAVCSAAILLTAGCREETSAEAQANADTLKQQVTAARQLYEKQEMSEVQYGKLLAAAAAAAAVRQAAAAQVDLVEAGTRPEEIAKGEALVDAAEADLASAQLALEFCTIRSPIAGRVTQLFARAGIFAERAIVLATVTDLSSLFAKVRIPSDHQADLARDAVARVTIAALPNQTFQGKIARLSGQADRTTGTCRCVQTGLGLNGRFPYR